MELKEALGKLEKSKELMAWKQKNPGTFFSYALKIIEENKEEPWSLGFYNKSTDKVVTFVVGSDIEVQEEEEIFKKPETVIKPIETEKAKISFSGILEKAREFTDKTYPNELISKTIAVIQNLEKYGTVWNITYITHSFNTINIKASPEDGKILYNNIESIMGMIKK
ncbi:hypothetical protein HYU09_02950 [Candidatus Woesearchaeota archaeon]|nr:hypothetical protein [Candidatus Woesearchaeota archaeon]